MSLKENREKLGLPYVRAFTEAYRKSDDPYEREMNCEFIQFPRTLAPPTGEEDLIVGKRFYPEVGYSVQYGGMGYYFTEEMAPSSDEMAAMDREAGEEWLSLKAFWAAERTEALCREALPPIAKERIPGVYDGGRTLREPAYTLYRMSGLQMDLGKLVRLGIPGLIRSVDEAFSGGENRGFAKSLLASVDTLVRCIDYYLALPLPDVVRKNLGHIRQDRPETFHQALQLIQLAVNMSGTINYGRLDMVLGPYLKDDLEQSRITWEEALAVLKDFYKVINEEIIHFDGRIIVGGRGRRGHGGEDQFALLAIEAIEKSGLPMPQLTLRFHDGQDPELLRRAYGAIGKGTTFPMLYNDDVNIGAIQKSFRLDRVRAEQVIPFGCGEYMVQHRSSDTPNAIINLLYCLELALNGGEALLTGERKAPDFGSLESYGSFEELFEAYEKTVDFFLEPLALGQESLYRTTGALCPFSFVSLLYDDCLERRMPLFGGGVEILGGTNETYGNNNTADSLAVIRKLVFDEGITEGKTLLEALRRNWEGGEDLLSHAKGVTKFGNDDDGADGMQKRVHDHICLKTIEAGRRTELDHFLVVVINNNHNTLWGKFVGASADGRRALMPMAPGNSAAAGADASGVTALLNSLAKPRIDIHAGAVQNVKLSPSMVASEGRYHSLINGYFKKGGAQIMISVVNNEDLRRAMERPRDYPNLVVRVGGFSARFIDLDRETQREILSRTEYQSP